MWSKIQAMQIFFVYNCCNYFLLNSFRYLYVQMVYLTEIKSPTEKKVISLEVLYSFFFTCISVQNCILYLVQNWSDSLRNLFLTS